MKKKLSVGAVLVIVLILATVTSFAATGGFGLIDMINRRSDKGILPEASDIIASDIEQTSQATQWADFTVREAVYDGNMLYAVLAAKPLTDDVLLIPDYYAPDDAIGSLGIGDDPIGNNNPDFDHQTIGEYAMENGKRLISIDFEVTLKDGGAYDQYNWLAGSDALLEEDGTLVCLVHSEDYQDAAANGNLNISVHCLATPMRKGQGESYLGGDGELIDVSAFYYLYEESQTGQIDFTLKNGGVRAKAHTTETAEFMKGVVRIDEIILTSTPLYTKVDVLYTVLDAKKFARLDSGLWFEFLDDSGKRAESGAIGDGSIQNSIGGTGVNYRQISHIIAMETLPDHLTVRAYNAWSKDVFETKVFALVTE